MRPNIVVFGGRHANRVGATRVGALAHHLRAGQSAELKDPLVHLAEQRLARTHISRIRVLCNAHSRFLLSDNFAGGLAARPRVDLGAPCAVGPARTPSGARRLAPKSYHSSAGLLPFPGTIPLGCPTAPPSFRASKEREARGTMEQT